MDFTNCEQIFDEVYQELKDNSTESWPDSNTWIAPTVPELAKKTGVPASGYNLGTLGEGSPVAAAYDYAGNTLTIIRDQVDAIKLRQFFRSCVGLDAEE